MLIIGIDPGQSGGIAINIEDESSSRIPEPFARRGGMQLSASLTFDKCNQAAAVKMPETPAEILALLRDLKSTFSDGFAFIENVGVMPKQGISSAATFMKHVGGLQMALLAAGIPFDLVTPQVWQRALGCLSKGDKNVTKRRAQSLFPALTITHAIADALLIMEYGRRYRAGMLPAIARTGGKRHGEGQGQNQTEEQGQSRREAGAATEGSEATAGRAAGHRAGTRSRARRGL